MSNKGKPIATLNLKHWPEYNAEQVWVDCKHSTTTGFLIMPSGKEPIHSLNVMVAGLCEEALAKTPCNCMERMLAVAKSKLNLATWTGEWFNWNKEEELL